MNKFLFISISCTSLLACGGTEADMSDDASLQLEMSTLPDLGADFVYEGWLIVDDSPVSTGSFVIDGDGAPTPASFTASAEDAANATLFVLTIEPANDPDPAPSSTHILAGAFDGEVATLSIDHPAALATDFTDATGSFILATPTTGDSSLPAQGIWFLAPGDTPSSSLQLPDLPAGWVYEGWVAGESGATSTGRFTSASGMDSDGAGPSKGPSGDGPAFPGADFINPAMVLNDGGTAAVISVEPDPDTSPDPFLMKPLVLSPIGSEVAPVMQAMDNNASNTNPSARITLRFE